MATDKTNAIPTYEEVVSLIKKTIDEHETLAKIGYFNNGVLNETVLMNFRNAIRTQNTQTIICFEYKLTI